MRVNDLSESFWMLSRQNTVFGIGGCPNVAQTIELRNKCATVTLLLRILKGFGYEESPLFPQEFP